MRNATDDAALMTLMRAIVADEATALRLLTASPALASARVQNGASREDAETWFLDAIGHYVYAGDTALHVAAAAYRHQMVPKLMAMGADVRGKNRRGAEPLHYAADGRPGSLSWNPDAQTATIASLIAAGADPNVADKNGATPLTRAVRTRSAAAVAALLAGGADAQRESKRGSTPMRLANHTSGRGGSGSPAAKAQQAEIVRLLAERGAQ